MTRVAWLNPQMWAELFLENRDYLMRELDILSENEDNGRRARGDRKNRGAPFGGARKKEKFG